MAKAKRIFMAVPFKDGRQIARTQGSTSSTPVTRREPLSPHREAARPRKRLPVNEKGLPLNGNGCWKTAENVAGRQGWRTGSNMCPASIPAHDHARSRAYRWGEDGLAALSDDQLWLCLGLALWNGRDPILKERLFGLTNGEGNHGEDVKELYWYLDATPSHSYLKMLYKYPQAEFPYARLVAENRRRGRGEPELELLDTGVFDGDRYFDVFVEYAK